MAEVEGVNKTLSDDPKPNNIMAMGRMEGKVRHVTDTYEAAALAAGEQINIGRKIPKGSRVLYAIMGWDALGASVTLQLGDAEDPNRYITSQDGSTAGVQGTNVVDGLEYEIDETDSDNLDSQIQVLTGGAAATGTIRVTVFYTFE